MEFIAKLNDNLEIENFEATETVGAITRTVTVLPGEDYFRIKEKIFNGKDKIYCHDVVVGKDILEAIQEFKAMC